ncbi:stress-associated endoplasmic reticulum protein 2-like [Senna tora]|uniref:Stress-associated endoplasmic reticulum protein 2-like n=1 Tax=Senna tora TaxID=362788 RepID=A0A834W4F0_9FABA|nr:stress-associated endoplasmic reticulum protein 2-like [Senna tora]
MENTTRRVNKLDQLKRVGRSTSSKSVRHTIGLTKHMSNLDLPASSEKMMDIRDNTSMRVKLLRLTKNQLHHREGIRFKHHLLSTNHTSKLQPRLHTPELGTKHITDSQDPIFLVKPATKQPSWSRTTPPHAAFFNLRSQVPSMLTLIQSTLDLVHLINRVTTSRRLADRKVARFQKNIAKKGSENSSKKGYNYPVGPIVLGFFIFVIIGSSLFQIIRTATSGGMA